MVSQMQRAFAQKLASNKCVVKWVFVWTIVVWGNTDSFFNFSVTPSPQLSADPTALNSTTPNNESSGFPRVDSILPTVVEPVDYESYSYQHHTCGGSNSIENDDPLMEFPDGSDDVDVYVLPRKVRTLLPPGPEEDM